MDQDMLNEVLGSVVAGRPIWRGALTDCAEEKTDALGHMHDAVQKYIDWGSKRKVGDPLDPFVFPLYIMLNRQIVSKFSGKSVSCNYVL